MELKEEQKKKLVIAVKQYRKAAAAVDKANADFNEVVNGLKTASGATGAPALVYDAALKLLGETYVQEFEEKL